MPSNPPPSDAVPIFRFSTDAFPERERMAAWREIFGRTVVNLDIEPLNPEAFRAEAAVCQLPGLGVLRASSAAVHLARVDRRRRPVVHGRAHVRVHRFSARPK
jgi:hypothetical protein